MMTIRKKDFRIIGHYVGKNIRGHENDWEYSIICIRTGKTVEDGFPTKTAADRWLSENIRLANEIRKRKLA